MKKINLDKVEKLKPFINYEGENILVEITEVSEIPNEGLRFTVENMEDNHIQFLKFYMTDRGLPFYKKFIEDANINEKIASYPLSLLGQQINIKTVYVNEKTKITKIVQVSEAIPL